jgi:hypothetical protein
LAPGPPFSPNLGWALYLRFPQAIPFERLARLMFDLLGLEISEGYWPTCWMGECPIGPEE